MNRKYKQINIGTYKKKTILQYHKNIKLFSNWIQWEIIKYAIDRWYNWYNKDKIKGKYVTSNCQMPEG